jgi:hypothetical protein
MIAEQLQDLKTELREFPELAAALLLAIVIGVGFKMAVFCNAIGNEFHVHTSKGLSAAEQLQRLRMQSCSAELKPGFTVIIELRRHDVEMNVPLDGVGSLLDGVRTNVIDSLHG